MLTIFSLIKNTPFIFARSLFFSSDVVGLRDANYYDGRHYLHNDAKYPLISRAITKPISNVAQPGLFFQSNNPTEPESSSQILTHRNCTCFNSIKTDCKHHIFKRQNYRSYHGSLKSSLPRSGLFPNKPVFTRLVDSTPINSARSSVNLKTGNMINQFDSKSCGISLDTCRSIRAGVSTPQIDLSMSREGKQFFRLNSSI